LARANEKKKKWLMRFAAQQERVQAAIRRLYEARAEAAALGINLDKMPTGTADGQSLPRAVERIIEAENRVARACDERDRIRDEIETAICAIGVAKLEKVLMLRYLDCIEDWDVLADFAHYSKRQTQRLHGEALERIRIPKKEKTPE